jgi:hypothetical protein
MILSGTINTKRRLVNVTLSLDIRFCYVMLSVILTGYGSTRNPRVVNLRAVTHNPRV